MELPKYKDFYLESINKKDLEKFSCEKNLEKYFKEDAIDSEEELISKTYFLKKSDISAPLVAFSISNSHIETCIEIDQSILPNIQYKIYPAVLIGRFATHNNHVKKGYGKIAMDLIKTWFISENKTGCRFIVVDSRKEAVNFYEKCDFDIYPISDDKSTTLLYFDLLGYKIQIKNL